MNVLTEADLQWSLISPTGIDPAGLSHVTRLHSDWSQLRRILDQLDRSRADWQRGGDPASRRAMARDLRGLFCHLLNHLRYEEESGLILEYFDRCPEQRRSVEQLLRLNRSLLEVIAGMEESLALPVHGIGSASGPDLPVDRLIGLVEDHLDIERQLLHGAFGVFLPSPVPDLDHRSCSIR